MVEFKTESFWLLDCGLLWIKQTDWLGLCFEDHQYEALKTSRNYRRLPEKRWLTQVKMLVKERKVENVCG